MSFTKSKSKSKVIQPETDEEIYHHPILEEQIIIRFPPDIAQNLNGKMDDNNFTDFEITFTDKHHAQIKIDDEILQGTLLNLPTIVETHRTVDGSHLFKSADIGEILIVYRPTKTDPLANDIIKEEMLYKNGITPPTIDIIEKRKAKQESARAASADSSSQIEGIEYWEMVEIQLAALLSKDKSAKPITRHEFFEEPEIDPVVLEKALRLKYGNDYKGYSGTIIDDSQLNATDTEPIVNIPPEILETLQPAPKSDKEAEEEEDISDILSSMENAEESETEEESEESPNPESKESEKESSVPASQSTDAQKSAESEKDEYYSSSGEYEEDEEEEEKNEKVRELKSHIKKLEKMIAEYETKLPTATNKSLKERYQSMINSSKEKIESLKAEIEKAKNGENDDDSS